MAPKNQGAVPFFLLITLAFKKKFLPASQKICMGGFKTRPFSPSFRGFCHYREAGGFGTRHYALHHGGLNTLYYFLKKDF
jgi:hypothetical protein